MGMNMIYHASIGKKGNVIHYLHNGVDVDAMNHKHETALYFAAKYGRASTVKTLLNYGADPNHMSLNGLTPVSIAAYRNNHSCLISLLRAGGTWFKSEDIKIIMANNIVYNKHISEKLPHSFDISSDEIFHEYDTKPLNIAGMFKVEKCQARGMKLSGKIKKITTRQRDETFDKIMRNEFDYLRAIRHPNIIQSFYKSELQRMDNCIILTESIGAGNLYHVIHRLGRKISISESKELIVQITQACQFLHQKHITHNFINSSSIYFVALTKIKLGNFEYSCASDQLVVNMLHLDKRFHLGYMACETITDNRISTASDVYSYGCLVWEIFSHKMPWSWIENSEIVILNRKGFCMHLPMHSCWPKYMRYIVECSNKRETTSRPTFEGIIKFLQLSDNEENIGHNKSLLIPISVASSICIATQLELPGTSSVDNTMTGKLQVISNKVGNTCLTSAVNHDNSTKFRTHLRSLSNETMKNDDKSININLFPASLPIRHASFCTCTKLKAPTLKVLSHNSPSKDTHIVGAKLIPLNVKYISSKIEDSSCADEVDDDPLRKKLLRDFNKLLWEMKRLGETEMSVKAIIEEFYEQGEKSSKQILGMNESSASCDVKDSEYRHIRERVMNEVYSVVGKPKTKNWAKEVTNGRNVQGDALKDFFLF